MFPKLIVGLLFLLAPLATNSSANDAKLELLTNQRIAALPEPQRSQWQEYLKRSADAHRIEVEQLAQERAKPGVTPKPAPGGRQEFELPSKVDEAWLAAQSDELIAAVISFQTPTGGWSKAVNYSKGRASRVCIGPANRAKAGTTAERWIIARRPNRCATWPSLARRKIATIASRRLCGPSITCWPRSSLAAASTSLSRRTRLPRSHYAQRCRHVTCSRNIARHRRCQEPRMEFRR